MLAFTYYGKDTTMKIQEQYSNADAIRGYKNGQGCVLQTAS